jgi:hypothetical protein
MHSPLSMQEEAHLRERGGTVPGAHDVEYTRNDVVGVQFDDSGGADARADLDALAALCTGVDHEIDATGQSRLEGEIIHLAADPAASADV